MLKSSAAFRAASTEAALNALMAANQQYFWSRDHIYRVIGHRGRTLDRILSELVVMGKVKRFHLVLEDNHQHDEVFYGFPDVALQFRKLDYKERPDGHYELSEASSDDVICYMGGIDARLRPTPAVEASTPWPALANVFFKLASCAAANTGTAA